MAQELIYTSAPRGLRMGTSGFCTVACTRGMAPNYVEQLESLSGYSAVFAPHDPNAHLNPAASSHYRYTMGGKPVNVLSRVAFAGVDHTQRSNKFAYHLVLDSTERIAAGPAWLLEQEGVMLKEWEGRPRYLEKRKKIDPADAPPVPCERWKKFTGDAGYAGVLAQSFLDNSRQPAFIIFEPGIDPLPLIGEALRLLRPEQRWNVTFNTYFTSLPLGTTCIWRCCLKGSPVLRQARRQRGSLVLDLTAGPNQPEEAARRLAEDFPLIQCAREGKALPEPEEEEAPSGDLAAARDQVMQLQKSKRAAVAVAELSGTAAPAAPGAPARPSGEGAWGAAPTAERKRLSPQKAMILGIAISFLFFAAVAGTVLFLRSDKVGPGLPPNGGKTSPGQGQRPETPEQRAARERKEKEAEERRKAEEKRKAEEQQAFREGYDKKLGEAETLEKQKKWPETIAAWKKLRSIGEQLEEKPPTYGDIDNRITKAEAAAEEQRKAEEERKAREEAARKAYKKTIPTGSSNARIVRGKYGLADAIRRNDGRSYKLELPYLTPDWRVEKVGGGSDKSSKKTENNGLQLVLKHKSTGRLMPVVTITPQKGGLFFEKTLGRSDPELNKCLGDVEWIDLHYEPLRKKLRILTKAACRPVQLKEEKLSPEDGRKGVHNRACGTIALADFPLHIAREFRTDWNKNKKDWAGKEGDWNRLKYSHDIQDQKRYKATVRARIDGDGVKVTLRYKYPTPANITAAKEELNTLRAKVNEAKATLSRARKSKLVKKAEEALTKAEARFRYMERVQKAEKATIEKMKKLLKKKPKRIKSADTEEMRKILKGMKPDEDTSSFSLQKLRKHVRLAKERVERRVASRKPEILVEKKSEKIKNAKAALRSAKRKANAEGREDALKRAQQKADKQEDVVTGLESDEAKKRKSVRWHFKTPLEFKLGDEVFASLKLLPP